MDGERSSLITEAIRLIKECRPSFFIWENVKGTFSSNSGEDFWAIIQAFTNIGGYRLEWQLLNTKWFLPQNRERIYLVGCLGEGSGKQIFPITENSRETNELQGQQANTCTLTTRYKDSQGNGSYIIERELDEKEEIIVGDFRNDEGFRPRKDGDSPCLATRRCSETDISTMPPIIKPTQIGNSKKFGNAVGKHNQDAFTLRSANPNGVILNQSIRRLTPVECERLQGFPDNWTKNGIELSEISDSQRYKMCGNAVTVDVVEAVAKKIKESLSTKI
jgi:DNA (cytosine-5)-methyltransferase 1